jgi:flagellar hook-associated protein 1 FlgK
MSLDIALQYAVSGLDAMQAQIQVASGNIANAQTPGYSEETLPQTSDPATNGGAGVVTGEVQRATDPLLQQALLGQATTAGNAATTNTFYQQVEALFGQVGSGTTIADTLNNFASAMQTAAATPQDTIAQVSAVNAGQQLAQQLNSLSSNIQGLRQSADQQVGTDVQTANNTINTIAQLNGQISQLQALGQSTATLQDQRDQAVSQLAQLVGIQTYTGAGGMLDVITTQGASLVDGSTAQQFSFAPSGTVAASSTLSPLTLGGVDVTSQTTSGQMGALLQMRDTTLPALTAQLNQFTNNLFNASSSSNLQTTNSGLNATNDANNFFANVNLGTGLDNAATIEVNPSLVANPALLDTGTAGPDPSITATLSANLQGTSSFAAAGGLAATTTTLSSYIGNVIGSASTTAASATSNSSDQQALMTQMQGQYSSATGVDLNTELSTLITYQNAYAASARVITIIQTMYAALMNA